MSWWQAFRAGRELHCEQADAIVLRRLNKALVNWSTQDNGPCCGSAVACMKLRISRSQRKRTKLKKKLVPVIPWDTAMLVIKSYPSSS